MKDSIREEITEHLNNLINGEVLTLDNLSEAVVNMYVYIKGEELLQDIQEELKEKLEGEAA